MYSRSSKEQEANPSLGMPPAALQLLLSRGTPTADRHAAESHASFVRSSDGLLQRSGAECLHNGLRWLRLHDHSLSEHLPLACLGGWLQACLDHAETRDGELASALHLLGRHASQGVQDLTNLRLLQVVRGGDGISKAGLGHDRLRSLHGRLHCLHRSHLEDEDLLARFEWEDKCEDAA